MTAKFAKNSSFLEYQRLLVEVQYALIRGDIDMANSLRQDSERVGENLSEEEIDWLYGLSGDLDMLTDEEVFERPELSPQRWVRALQFASVAGDGETILRLLRQKAPFVRKDQRAYLRSNAYDLLSYTELSLVFMRYAAECAPNHDGYPSLIMEKLVRLQRLSEAKEAALTSIDRPNASPSLKVFAAGALFASTRSMNELEAVPLFIRSIKTLESLLSIENTVKNLTSREFLYANMVFGSCYQRTGRIADALQVYSEVLEIDPDDADLLTLRGNLLLDENLSQALADYECAVKIGSSSPTPYFVLARETLLKSDFRRCQYLCRKVLKMTLDTRVVAITLGFLAICYHETGQSLSKVQKLFQEAIALDPDNEALQQNYQTVMERNLQSQKKRVSEIKLQDLRNLCTPLSDQTQFTRESQNFNRRYAESNLQDQIRLAAA